MKKYLLFVFIMCFANSCYDKIETPILNGFSIDDKTPYTADVSAVISFDGNDNIVEKGFCIIKGSKTPTYYDCDSIIKCSSNYIGVFSAKIGGLQPKTDYSVVAFAKNSKFIGYSNAIFFKTLN